MSSVSTWVDSDTRRNWPLIRKSKSTLLWDATGKEYVQKMTKHVWYNTFYMDIIKTTKWTIILMQYLIRYLNWWYMQHFTQLWKLFLDNVSWNIYINSILSHVVIQYMFLLLPFLASNSLLTILLRSRTSDPAGMENGTSSITYL